MQTKKYNKLAFFKSFGLQTSLKACTFEAFEPHNSVSVPQCYLYLFNYWKKIRSSRCYLPRKKKSKALSLLNMIDPKILNHRHVQRAPTTRVLVCLVGQARVCAVKPAGECISSLQHLFEFLEIKAAGATSNQYTHQWEHLLKIKEKLAQRPRGKVGC